MLKLLLITFGFVLLSGDEVCVLKSSEPFGYVGDVSGKRLYTKEEFTYECTTTTTEKGDCVEWKEEQEDYNISAGNNNVYYESENFQGSIGDIFATAQSYDKINGLWSGWHGFCQKGADDGNWDWMSDPYVLAGYALSAISASIPVAPAASDAASATADAASATADAASATADAASATADAASATADAASATAYAVDIANKAVCAARADLDIAQMIEEYNSDDLPCDPVDEFCDGSDDAADDNSNIFTVPEDDYNEMLENNPDMEEYMQIIDGTGTGVLTIIVLNPNTSKDAESAEAAEAAKQEAKELTLKIKGALTTLELASCLSGTDVGGSGADSVSSLLSATSVLKMSLSAINPLLGMAASIALNVADSMMSSIDTCDNEQDAKEKGSRQEATYNALKYNLCHEISVQKSGDKTLNTYKEEYTYCCYDDKITRIVVEQTKAQLAKDWQHCTDITINELKVVSFASCDPKELDAGIDGTKLSAYATLAERMSAYQYTHKCIDTRELMEVTLEKFGGDDMLIDDQYIQDMLEDMK
jgi:hypothetical protein